MEKMISIIIPVYRTEKYLRDCLDSVLCQSGEEIEIICVNDGSPDGSLEILREYAKKDGRIEIITTENQGLSMARNTGIAHATGKYICFLDSDDMLKEGALKELCQRMQNHQLELLCYDAECIYENEALYHNFYKDHYYQREESYGQASGQELFARFMEHHSFCDAAWILCIDRQWLKETGIMFYPHIVHEDCLFSFQCFLHAKRAEHINERYVIYRIRENSIMTDGKWFESLRGRITCYVEIMKQAYSKVYDERTQRAIAAYIRFVCENAKYADFEMSEDERRRYAEFSIYEKMHMECMGLNERQLDAENESIYGEAFEKRVQEAEKIWIYGAGLVGNRVLQYLEKIGKADAILGFIISDTPKNDRQIAGKKVYGIKQVRAEAKEALVMIAARSQHQPDMVDMASECKFSKLLLIDMVLEKRILSTILQE